MFEFSSVVQCCVLPDQRATLWFEVFPQPLSDCALSPATEQSASSEIADLPKTYPAYF